MGIGLLMSIHYYYLLCWIVLYQFFCAHVSFGVEAHNGIGLGHNTKYDIVKASPLHATAY